MGERNESGRCSDVRDYAYQVARLILPLALAMAAPEPQNLIAHLSQCEDCRNLLAVALSERDVDHHSFGNVPRADCHARNIRKTMAWSRVGTGLPLVRTAVRKSTTVAAG